MDIETQNILLHDPPGHSNFYDFFQVPSSEKDARMFADESKREVDITDQSLKDRFSEIQERLPVHHPQSLPFLTTDFTGGKYAVSGARFGDVDGIYHQFRHFLRGNAEMKYRCIRYQESLQDICWKMRFSFFENMNANLSDSLFPIRLIATETLQLTQRLQQKAREHEQRLKEVASVLSVHRRRNYMKKLLDSSFQSPPLQGFFEELSSCTEKEMRLIQNTYHGRSDVRKLEQCVTSYKTIWRKLHPSLGGAPLPSVISVIPEEKCGSKGMFLRRMAEVANRLIRYLYASPDNKAFCTKDEFQGLSQREQALCDVFLFVGIMLNKDPNGLFFDASGCQPRFIEEIYRYEVEKKKNWTLSVVICEGVELFQWFCAFLDPLFLQAIFFSEPSDLNFPGPPTLRVLSFSQLGSAADPNTEVYESHLLFFDEQERDRHDCTSVTWVIQQREEDECVELKEHKVPTSVPQGPTKATFRNLVEGVRNASVPLSIKEDPKHPLKACALPLFILLHVERQRPTYHKILIDTTHFRCLEIKYDGKRYVYQPCVSQKHGSLFLFLLKEISVCLPSSTMSTLSLSSLSPSLSPSGSFFPMKLGSQATYVLQGTPAVHPPSYFSSGWW
uniref:Uncharacterized protein n=1 Tax=Palpitomonas bilix TaxID=652834 RepID=A0A7S3CVV3_9EUKA|mmetsp:Transcript_11475/g.30456  ORF Transcript_11475/g.30456 Transcript_11475/m.30456 type:complete len:616 (+) Transcript_11475:1516-3363(+)